MKLWLIGAGSMAQDYVKVLRALDVPFEVIGRGNESASKFFNSTGIKVQTGGVSLVLERHEAPDTAIVSVGVDQLAKTTTALIKAGTHRILLEKPGGLNFEQIKVLNDVAVDYKSNVWLAYNRRFFGSTLKAEDFILDDGGVSSLRFEFTEWSNEIKDLKKSDRIKQFWLLGNSSHVIDLAFYLGGKPREWACWHDGALEWHQSSSRFCGAGKTECGVNFSYFADWEAPGRWGLEVLTRKRRLIFIPMEQLHVIETGTTKSFQVELDNDLDVKYKPGLFRQTEDFLKNQTERLLPLAEQVIMAGIYSKMAGY